MAPPTWASTEETAWLNLQLPEYVSRQATKKLYKFWPPMFEGYFATFPPHAKLGLPTPSDLGDAPMLTDAQMDMLGDAMRKKRRHKRSRMVSVGALQRRSESSLANALFKLKPMRHRRHQPIEIFQKQNPDLINAALDEAGYNGINEEQMSKEVDGWIDESEESHNERVRGAKSERMRLRTRVVKALWDEASVDERARCEKIAEKEREKPLVEESAEDDEPTPAEYQLAIDECGDIFAKIHSLVMSKAGWCGITIIGGPNPRLNGELSMKIICHGVSPAGNDFQSSHSTFDTSLTVPFQQWLRRVYPMDVRRARAATIPDDGSNDSHSDDDEAMPPPPMLEQPNSESSPKKKKPKRMTKPKRAKQMSTEATTEATAGPSSSEGAAEPPVAAEPARIPDIFDAVAADSDDTLFSAGADNFYMDVEPASVASTSGTQWPKGMPPPSSPGTAAMAARIERGGLSGGPTFAIDPSLLSPPSPAIAAATSPTPERPRPRPANIGAAFTPRRPNIEAPTVQVVSLSIVAIHTIAHANAV
ncbi:hypothetical protein B0H10DRAFT_1968992 [Mycena sp. CBHHK59/15]|nr:hypothetical protein B0H10DRAFT_1968992 [Mycena sp. CBHHK59/15]